MCTGEGPRDTRPVTSTLRRVAAIPRGGRVPHQRRLVLRQGQGCSFCDQQTSEPPYYSLFVRSSGLRSHFPYTFLALMVTLVGTQELYILPGCDINARDEIGYTALHLSAEHGYTEMMKTLIKHNAQVNFNIPPEFDDEFPTDALDEPLRLAIKVSCIDRFSLPQLTYNKRLYINFTVERSTVIHLVVSSTARPP